MSTVRAGELLRIWDLRLRIHDDDRPQRADQFRHEVEGLVARLRTLSEEEEIETDAEAERDPIARFTRVSTGEILGELHQVPRSE
jgi:hypothetical protein